VFEGFKPRQDLSGFTAIPNEFFDAVLEGVESISELKVILAVFRKTYGWVTGFLEGKPVFKIEDEISYSQFQKLTGLKSNGSISEGLSQAMSHGFIVRVKKGTFAGGNREGISATYRIRTLGVNLEEFVAEVLPTPECVVGRSSEVLPTPICVPGKSPETEVLPTPECVLTKETIFLLNNYVPPTPECVLTRSFAEETASPATPKKDREVFSTKDIKSPTKGRKMYDLFLEKKAQDYNANDLCFYFSTKFEKIIGVRYGGVTQKDRRLMKQLLDTYKSENVATAVDYLMSNYREWVDTPSISVLFGFRNTVFPKALSDGMKVDVRQAHFDENEKSGIGW